MDLYTRLLDSQDRRHLLVSWPPWEETNGNVISKHYLGKTAGREGSLYRWAMRTNPGTSIIVLNHMPECQWRMTQSTFGKNADGGLTVLLALWHYGIDFIRAGFRRIVFTGWRHWSRLVPYMYVPLSCTSPQLGRVSSSSLPTFSPRRILGSSRPQKNLSATAARVLQCICIVAASRKDCSAIVNMIWYLYKTGCLAGERYIYGASGCFRRFSWELCTAVNLFGIKIYLSLVAWLCLLCLTYIFTIWHKFRPLGVGESVTTRHI